MAVRPINVLTNGDVEVWHDEANHGGVVDDKDCSFVVSEDGSIDWRYFILPCPLCDSVSIHPVGGGCDPKNVQKLFIKKLKVKKPKTKMKNAVDEVRNAVEAMDGPERWRGFSVSADDNLITPQEIA
jgi:hypothetical protein